MLLYVGEKGEDAIAFPPYSANKFTYIMIDFFVFILDLIEAILALITGG
jgi:hypothetical protein